PAIIIIMGIFDVQTSTAGTSGRAFVGALRLVGNQPAGLAIKGGPQSNSPGTFTIQWSATLNAGSHLTNLRAYRGNGALGTDPVYTLQANQTKLSALCIEL